MEQKEHFFRDSYSSILPTFSKLKQWKERKDNLSKRLPKSIYVYFFSIEN